MGAAACQVPAALKESLHLTHSRNKPKRPPAFPFNPTTSPASLGTSGCLRGPKEAERTYLNDFTILSALPAGWAPGDSFLRLKMPSLFFMSLALGAEAEKGGSVSLACSAPATSGWEGCAQWRGDTYSFIV